MVMLSYCYLSRIATSRTYRCLHWCRLRSSNAARSRSAAQEYLDGFLGLPNPNQGSAPGNNNSNMAMLSPVLRARAAMAKGPLLLSGTSYLLPTLRLERHESPQSLTSRLQHASPAKFDKQYSDDSPTWCCPIILDASALSPDGSPHYQPPPPGSLTDMISVLSTFGMHVIGITKLSSQLEQEAAQAGIPSIWAPRRAGADPKFDLSQVLQLVQQKQQLLPHKSSFPQQPALDDSTTVSSASSTPKIDQGSNHARKTPESTEGVPLENIAEQNETTTPESAEGTLLESNAGQNETTTPDLAIPPAEFSSSSTLYHGSVRSGQQILSAKGQSLVIVGSVNSGGEVLSDGDIFIFGKLRGRAFAGLGTTGDDGTHSSSEHKQSTSPARIVATSFDAELVAIGDIFATIDRVEDLVSNKPLKAGQPVMVTQSLDGETPALTFSPVDQ